MDVLAHRAVIGEFDKLSDALAEGPANWMPGMFESATGKITELEAHIAFGGLTRRARIQVGPAQVEKNEVVVPITWRSLEAEPLFPILKGWLRLSRLPDDTNRLELEGHYEPPARIFGRAADAAVMHAVAEATVEDFVERVAAVLARNALGRSVADQVAAGRLAVGEDPVA